MLLGASQAAPSGCPCPDGRTGVRVGASAFVQCVEWGQGWGQTHGHLGLLLGQLGLHSRLLFHFQDVHPGRCGGRRRRVFAKAGPCLGIFPEGPGWRNIISAPREWAKSGFAPTHPSPSPHPCLTRCGRAGGWRNTVSPCSSRELLAGCLP